MKTFEFIGGPLDGKTIEAGAGRHAAYRSATTGEPVKTPAGDAIRHSRNPERHATLYILVRKAGRQFYLFAPDTGHCRT